jgi:hypothetical protein
MNTFELARVPVPHFFGTRFIVSILPRLLRLRQYILNTVTSLLSFAGCTTALDVQTPSIFSSRPSPELEQLV